MNEINFYRSGPLKVESMHLKLVNFFGLEDVSR